MTSELPRIEVAVPAPVYGTYTYEVPEDLRGLTPPGVRVIVGFGKRRLAGYVLGPDTRQTEGDIKPIDDIVDEKPIFPADMIPFFRWISDYYLHPIGEVITEALPGGINPTECAVLHLCDQGRCACEDGQTGPLETDILKLLESGPQRLDAVCRKLGCDIKNSLVRKMARCGWIIKESDIRRGRVRPKTERYVAPADAAPPADGLTAPKRAILKFLTQNGESSVAALKQAVPTAASHIRSMEKSGHVTIFEKPVYRDPFGEPVEPDTPPALTFEQKVVVKTVTDAMGNGFSSFLLAGVTGSGKTEVYMNLAARTLEQGRTTLILVPEIALISEVERRFRARFGECVGVLHSGLSAGERYDQWCRIANNDAPIAIGARSAVFAPLSNIGLIIVDEEHDSSYKQETRFHYNARDMALVRAQQNDAIALLGSATPSVQSIYNVATKKFTELTLTRRVFKQELPAVEIVDLRKHKDVRGSGRFITAELFAAMKETLARGEQVLLFLNRRGFASFPVCAECGATQKCRHCDITLTLHKKANIYKCHMCGYFRAAVSRCDTCDSPNIKQLGLGTEKIEATISKLFPEARVARMDRDTTQRKGSLLKMLKGLRNREIDILVGTQMVAKGHDFPGITLVGIICADTSLSFPDFRAGELTFQVLAQVAGRAGRGSRPGRVILQTYSPDHFSIAAAQQQDFMSFFNQEISIRKAFSYPPFSRMAQIKISGKDKDKTRQQAQTAGRLCQQIKTAQHQKSGRPIEVLGPIEAPVAKIAGRYRWQILIKAPGVDVLRRFLRQFQAENGTSSGGRDVHTAIDVDPFFMM